MPKALIAGVAAGLLMFVWGFVAHMVLRLGEGGIQTLTAEQEVAARTALRENFPGSGLYYLPWMEDWPNASEEEQADYQKRHEEGPVAYLVLQRDGAPVMPPSMMGLELLSNVGAALLVSFLALLLTGSRLKRALAIGGIGLAGWLSISASQTIWFRFPTETLVESGIEQGVGWLLSGLLIAWIVPAVGSKE